jgi:hypothetical protein
MQPAANDCITYVVLVLAALAAVLSAPGGADDAHRITQFLVSTAAPEASAIAGAVGENFRSPPGYRVGAAGLTGRAGG